MRKSIILAVLLVAAATSCQKEYMQGTDDLVNFRIKATREACADPDAKTRATVSDAGKFAWSADDAIGIWNGTSFQKLTTKNSGVSATFTGFVEGTLSDYAIYPSTAGKTVSSGAVTVTLPATYVWKKDEVKAPMLAAYDAKSLSFKYLGGIVVVSLKGVPSNATKFVFWTDKDITGDYTVNQDGEIKSAGNDSNKEVTFTFSLTAAADMVFYVPVPVGEYTFGFKLLDSADGEIAQKQGTKANKVERRDLMKMPELTCTNLTAGGEGTNISASISGGYKGTYYLPDTGADVELIISGDCTDAVTLAYPEGATSKPKNVTINAGENKVSSLTITLPESHVDVVGGTYTNIIAQTSLNTLVLGESAKIEQKLEIAAGSAKIAGEVKEVAVTADVEDKATIIVASTAKKIETLNVASGGKIEISAPVQNVTVASTVAKTAEINVAKDAKITGTLVVAGGGKVEIDAKEVAAVTIAESVPKAAEINVSKDTKVTTLAVTAGNLTIEGTVTNVTVKASESSGEEAKAPVIWVSGKVTGTLTNNNNDSVVVADSQGSEGSNIANVTGSNTTVKTPADFVKEQFAAGGTVNLEQDIKGNFTVENGKTVVLNLNDHKISDASSSSSSTIVVNAGGKLTVNGGEKGQVIGTSTYAAITNGGELTINGGCYEGGIDTEANTYAAITNSGKLTINGGYYKGVTDGEAISNSGTAVFSKSITYSAKYSVSHSGSEDKLSVEKNVSLPKVQMTGMTDNEVRSYVADETALGTALADSEVNTIILNGDIDVAGNLKATNTQTIDLNGYRLTGKLEGIDKLTPKGEGTLLSTCYAGTEADVNAAINDDNISKIVIMADIDLQDAIKVARKLTLELHGKTLKAATDMNGNQSVVVVKRYGDLTITDDSNGSGTITSNGRSAVYGAVKITEVADNAIGESVPAKLTIENGKFEGYYYAIIGQGTRHNTEITIKGGTFSGSAPTAQSIYHPQFGKLTISGGTFNGVNSAIELRAGTLNISGGVFTSTATVFKAKPNGSGSTIAGAALAISQHTTDLDIDVKVTGGTFSGIYAIYENDIQNNTGNVSVSVSGATLNGDVYSKHNESICNPKNVIHVSNEAELTSALGGSKEIFLLGDIQLANTLVLASGKTAVIDLGGHRLSAKSTATYTVSKKNQIAIFAVNGANLTVKNGFLGNDDGQNNFYGIYSGSASSVVKIEDVTYGKMVTYAFNGNGKFEAENCKFYGWLSGWHKGGTFTNCEFNVGKAYYGAAICYGTTTFDGCKFFKNGVNADEYEGPDTDGYYRHNYVVSSYNPAEKIIFTSCKFIDASGTETSVTVNDHPYHDKECPEKWGDGKIVSGNVTVDGAAVVSQCKDNAGVSTGGSTL